MEDDESEFNESREDIEKKMTPKYKKTLLEDIYSDYIPPINYKFDMSDYQSPHVRQFKAVGLGKVAKLFDSEEQKAERKRYKERMKKHNTDMKNALMKSRAFFLERMTGVKPWILADPVLGNMMLNDRKRSERRLLNSMKLKADEYERNYYDPEVNMHLEFPDYEGQVVEEENPMRGIKHPSAIDEGIKPSASESIDEQVFEEENPMRGIKHPSAIDEDINPSATSASEVFEGENPMPRRDPLNAKLWYDDDDEDEKIVSSAKGGKRKSKSHKRKSKSHKRKSTSHKRKSTSHKRKSTSHKRKSKSHKRKSTSHKRKSKN